jgi:saccharopine dehydrogenase-like NADP-dependent oxidoreductase
MQLATPRENTPIIIVGATGVFGQRLVQQLVACGKQPLVLAGRNLKTLNALRVEAAPYAICLVLDRLKPDAAVLATYKGGVLVDAAGPFQNSGLQLIDACIAAGVNYIDLADARDFVARVPALDAAAKTAGVFVICGASSTPALSHAVLDHLTKGWKSIHAIFVGITPGNRAPRGESVVRAILSFAGAPMRVFQHGDWQNVAGWGEQESRSLPGIGRRVFVHCETPDQDLLVARYQPKESAQFKAGLELGLMHHSLRLLSWLRRFGVVKNLTGLTAPLLFAANLLKPFGTDKGGMIVEVKGLDAKGSPVLARWVLQAGQGLGPNVPGLPALVLALRRQSLPSGAQSAAGLVKLAEIETHLQRIGITTISEITNYPGPDVFEQALGPEVWKKLPQTTRSIHQTRPGIVLKGEATVTGAATGLGRFVARLFGFPPAGENVPVSVVIESDGASESWRRQFGDKIMASTMTVAKDHPQSVEEHFGPFSFRLKLEAGAHGLTMKMDGIRIGPVTLPNVLKPEISAEERVDDLGRHCFNVRIAKSPFGLLVHYRGWLQLQ